MLIVIKDVLDGPALTECVNRLLAEQSAWIDGRATAGHQGALVKHNIQLDEASDLSKTLGAIVLSALQRNPEFVSAALPYRIYPPMFNRYEVGMHFGAHIDGAIRQVGRNGQSLRTDLSATLFLTDPADYQGGELVIEQDGVSPIVKLSAGSMVLYSAGTRHRIEPVTRGSRLAAVFWVQSMVRDDAMRNELWQLDQAIRLLTSTSANQDALITLTNHYHNLLRRWAEV